MRSRVLTGLHAHPVAIECHVSSGLPSTTLVGLADGAVREARQRIHSAIRHAGFNYPQGRVVINLAPAHLNKVGTHLDLAMALSILAATAQIDTSRMSDFEFLGELGLFGELRSIPGVLACAAAVHAAGRTLIAPSACAEHLSLAPCGCVGTVPNLTSAAQLLNSTSPPTRPPELTPVDRTEAPAGLSTIIGQSAAKRALVIAAAGGHHLLMVGPPGTGKTMLARSIVELLPALDRRSAMQVAALYSAAGVARDDPYRPPFRDPHHSASIQSLVGGGRTPLPGEAAFAHLGVLFLDEVPHFQPSVLNALREPLEAKEVVISRANYRVTYPTNFQLVAAMNPCPAGRVCDADLCRCTSNQVANYQNRVSGPMLDRVDLQITLQPIATALLQKLATRREDARGLKDDVIRARTRQKARQLELNSNLNLDDLGHHIARADLDIARFDDRCRALRISARGYHKLWRVALTIADLAGADRINSDHLHEALSYRELDWEGRLGLG